MVMIEVRAEGRVLGRCDANCYDAKGTECHCICGGANHGVGFEVAIEDRHFLTDDEILEECKYWLNGEKAAVIRPPIQGLLWQH